MRLGWPLLVLTLVLAPAVAPARTSDRDKPMDINAGRSDGTLGDSGRTTLSGGVTITQGTLDIRSDTAVIYSVDGSPVRAVLTGKPVTLRQELDDGSPMDAIANMVDYDLVKEIVIFTGAVSIRQPRGSIAGERIVYNLRTGQLQGGGDDAGRVRMRIMPRQGQGND